MTASKPKRDRSPSNEPASAPTAVLAIQMIQPAAEQDAGVGFSAVSGGHGVREIRIAEEKQRRESLHNRNL